jgi:hypothetical protein
MASTIIGALRVSLGLDSATFSKGLQGAQGRLADFDKKMRKIGGNMSKVGAAISLVGAGIAVALKGQIDAADELSKASQKFGVPIEKLSQLKHAADLSDVSFEELGKSFGLLSKKMLEANDGQKMAVDLFSRLGVSVADATGKLRPADDVLFDIANRLAAMPDGAEKTALALELFGRSGAALIPLLNGGGDALHSMMQEADALGLTITEKTGKAAEAFNDNLTRLRGALTGLTVQITAALAPAMEAISAKAVEWVQAFQKLSPETQKYLGIAAGLTIILGPLLVGLGAIVASVGTLTAAFVALAAATLANPVIALVAAIAAGAALIYMNWDGIVAYFDDLWMRVSQAGTDAWNTVLETWQAAGDFFSGFFIDLGNTFVEGWAKIKAIAAQWVDDFLQIGRDIIEGLKAGISERWDALVSWFKDKGDALTNSVKDVFGIHSPSRVFREIGQNVTEGLALGISDNAPMADAAMGDLSDTIGGSTDSLVSRMESFRSSAESAFTGLVTGALTFNEALSQVLSSLAEMLAKSAFSGLFGDSLAGGGLLSGIFGHANGTPSAPGGWTMVGERGPELVNMPRGAQVLSAQETRGVMSGGGSGGISLTIDARGAQAGVAEQIDAKLRAVIPSIVNLSKQAVADARKRGQAV